MPTRRAVYLLLGTAVLLAAAGWLSPLAWVALLYFVIANALLLADWRLASSGDAFEVTRTHDDKLSLGADNTISLSIRNRQPRSVPFWLRDEPPDRWVDEAIVLRGLLPANAVWRGSYTVHPLRRGDYRFDNLTLRWQGPLGLFIRQKTFDAGAPVKVYPNLLDVARYDLLLRRNRLQEIGLRNSRQFGRGTEYERLRDYQPDDDFRRINWKATARRHKPITVEYQVERSQNIMAVLDVGRMMQSPVAQMAKLDYVINATLLLGYVATGMGDKVGLMTFADEVRDFLRPKQGRGQFYRMLKTLYAIEAQPVEPDYTVSLNYLARRQRKRALTVIFTDLSGGLTTDLLISNVTALAKRSLPLVVTISDPDVVAASEQMPSDSLSVYQQFAASRLLEDRRIALDTLHRYGVHTLDVPANQLSLAVIQRYLDIKQKLLL